MPIGAQVGHGTVFEDGSASFMALAKGSDGNNATQAATASITCQVSNALGVSVATPTVVVGISIFDTLQTDARWVPEIDTTGYNFRHDMPAGTFTTGGRYFVHYKVTPSGGADFVYWLPFEVAAMRVFPSS